MKRAPVEAASCRFVARGVGSPIGKSRPERLTASGTRVLLENRTLIGEYPKVELTELGSQTYAVLCHSEGESNH